MEQVVGTLYLAERMLLWIAASLFVIDLVLTRFEKPRILQFTLSLLSVVLVTLFFIGKDFLLIYQILGYLYLGTLLGLIIGVLAARYLQLFSTANTARNTKLPLNQMLGLLAPTAVFFLIAFGYQVLSDQYGGFALLMAPVLFASLGLPMAGISTVYIFLVNIPRSLSKQSAVSKIFIFAATAAALYAVIYFLIVYLVSIIM